MLGFGTILQVKLIGSFLTFSDFDLILKVTNKIKIFFTTITRLAPSVDKENWWKWEEGRT